MTSFSWWLAWLPVVSVSLLGGMLAAGLSLLLRGRRAGPAVAVGLSVATAVLLLDLGIEGLPRVFEIAEITDYDTTAWLYRTMPEGTPAPDFLLVETGSGARVQFSSLRGDRPAVLIFASFG